MAFSRKWFDRDLENIRDAANDIESEVDDLEAERDELLERVAALEYELDELRKEAPCDAGQ